mgnify:CR=1 FL=1
MGYVLRGGQIDCQTLRTDCALLRTCATIALRLGYSFDATPKTPEAIVETVFKFFEISRGKLCSEACPKVQKWFKQNNTMRR